MSLHSMHSKALTQVMHQIDAELRELGNLDALAHLAQADARLSVFFERSEFAGLTERWAEGVNFTRLWNRWSRWSRQQARRILDRLSREEAAELLAVIDGCSHTFIKGHGGPGWCSMCMEAMANERR